MNITFLSTTDSSFILEYNVYVSYILFIRDLFSERLSPINFKKLSAICDVIYDQVLGARRGTSHTTSSCGILPWYQFGSNQIKPVLFTVFRLNNNLFQANAK